MPSRSCVNLREMKYRAAILREDREEQETAHQTLQNVQSQLGELYQQLSSPSAAAVPPSVMTTQEIQRLSQRYLELTGTNSYAGYEEKRQRRLELSLYHERSSNGRLLGFWVLNTRPGTEWMDSQGCVVGGRRLWHVEDDVGDFALI